jgi:hypothetical protein
MTTVTVNPNKGSASKGLADWCCMVLDASLATGVLKADDLDGLSVKDLHNLAAEIFRSSVGTVQVAGVSSTALPG